MRRRLFTPALLSCPFVAVSKEASKAVFSPLSNEMRAQLLKQRAFVSSLLAKSFPGERLLGTKKDLLLLQRALDAKLLPKTATWELQALGVVFGDVLVATVPGLSWWQVTDEYGTDPTVRYRETTFQINALTTLSKRVEAGETVNVEQLAAKLTEFVLTQARTQR
jgi:hypothetical protein